MASRLCPMALGKLPPSLALNCLTSKLLMTLTRDTSEGCNKKSGRYNIQEYKNKWETESLACK